MGEMSMPSITLFYGSGAPANYTIVVKMSYVATRSIDADPGRILQATAPLPCRIWPLKPESGALIRPRPETKCGW